ncbi:NADH-quinone oxidoreductase subunit C [Streptomyces sp. NPDC056738]|uniref:NADH-quinone oxidoreductase subunit C n=1 Tax=Streptomyces sp. NPDC056738 TaxID=3345933 RepID=UPI0036AB0DF8
MTVGWLPGPAEDLFGPDATAEESYEVLTVDVPPASWIAALETARDTLGCTYFDWLSAVDEPGTGFRVSAHVVALSPLHRLLVRTTVPHTAPALPSAVSVYAGAAWHERETHEMFGVTFEGHPGLDPLLLPEGFEGHPLRKDFVLAARVAKAWPGAKEPGESEHGGPKRRQMLPPGVPDPNEWGPLKGQLPPAPSRPARGAARPAGDRPVRRTRTAGEGSASQTPAAPADAPTAAGAGAGATGAAAGPVAAGAASGAETARPARRSRSVSQGSASQRTEQQPSPTSAPTPTLSPNSPATEGEPTAPATPPVGRSAAPRSSDAPWHQPKPAFDNSEPKPDRPEPQPKAKPEPKPEPSPESEPEAGTAPAPEPKPEPASEPEAEAGATPAPEAKTEPASESEPEAGTGPAREPKPKPEPAPESEHEAGAAPAPETKSEPEPEAATAPAPETKPEPGSKPAPSPDDPSGGTQ